MGSSFWSTNAPGISTRLAVSWPLLSPRKCLRPRRYSGGRRNITSRSSSSRACFQRVKNFRAPAHVVVLLRHIADYARAVGKFDTCAVCLLSEGNEAFAVVVAEGYPKETLGKSFPLESPSWAGWVLRARDEPLAIRMERRSGMPILDPKERSTTGTNFLAVPLRVQQRVCGALLLTRSGDAFTARELRLLRIYCNQAAVAMENAIVYERVENLAATDALTGLFNRRYLDGALERELARADRSDSSLALLMLDIDHFKSFNDTYGHAMGDLVLKKVASTLSDGLRQADVLARFGGEEFVVVLPQVTAAAALDSAERIRASVERASIHPGGERKHVTVSIGLAMLPDHGDSAETLLEAADQALYRGEKPREEPRLSVRRERDLVGLLRRPRCCARRHGSRDQEGLSRPREGSPSG